ncbi:CRE-TAF-6.1 protein [Caenorhabditis remanei]|uniref:CRE-TAF-6.1 protein n=1 Tax=Caenorhabditis remanei TaxID=31234 RepID=E3MDS0_CAERE|nr:CRE-TAF-6.1 protein [Caenorhabditis remanei]
MGQLNVSTVDTLNIGIQHLQQVAGTSGNPLFAYQKSDIDVDKEDTETFVKIPRDLRIISFSSEKPENPLQMIFLCGKRALPLILVTIMLLSMENDTISTRLSVFLPYLTERICKSISANISQRCLSLIIYAGRVLRSLSLNKACDMTVSLHHVIPSLLSCCVGRNMCLRPETDNHWALRDFSAKTLVMLVRDQVDKRDAGFTARRLFDFAHRIFRDSASSFSMIYGTIYILQEFIVDTRKATWLLAELSEMATRCKQHIEAGNRMQTTTSQLSMTEAAKLSQQITKSEAVIRTRHSIPSTVAAGGVAPLNRRFH